MQKISHQPSLVLIPGLGFRASIFKSIADQYEGFALLYDLPTIDQPVTLDTLIHQINEALPDDSVLIAWSLGGLIAISLCYSFPQKYKKLILVSSTPQFSSATIGIQNQLLQQFKEKAHSDFPVLLKKLRLLTADPHHQATLHQQLNTHLIDIKQKKTFLFYLDCLINTDYSLYFEHLSLPVLQIFGEQDAILPLTSAQSLAKRYPHVSTRIIKNASHISFLTHQSEWKKHVSLFLETSKSHIIQHAFNRAAKTYDDHCIVQKQVGETLIHHVLTQWQLHDVPLNAKSEGWRGRGAPASVSCGVRERQDPEALWFDNHHQVATVLDLGCGTGMITEKLKHIYENSILHAIDIADHLLTIAKKRLQNKNIIFHQADFDCLPQDLPCFDFIFSNMALHWSKDLNRTLKLIGQRLKKSGIVAFSIPLPGTFCELQYHFAMQSFHDAKEIETLLIQNHCRILYQDCEKLIQSFPDTLATLKSIKNIGANVVFNRKNKGLKGKSFLNSYHLHQLTYIIGYFIGIKNESK